MPKSRHYSPAPSFDVEEAAPPTLYSDDPNSNDSTDGNAQEDHDTPPRVPFRDGADGSVFDWGKSSSDLSQTHEGVLHNSEVQPSDIKMENVELSADEQMNVQESSSPKRKDDATFAPLSLDEDDDEVNPQLSRTQASQSHHPNINGIFGNICSRKCYLLRTCICTNRYAILCLAWIGMMIGFGFVGYQAGQSAENASSTKGQEWIDWIENSKDHIHWPHLHHTAPNNNVFAPQTQAQLLQTSNLIFHSCNKNSLSTSSGRNACLSACHGKMCCFEKEQRYGSCVNTPYSYCYVYAACENVLADFGMTNTNIVASSGGRLNEQDKALLGSACSTENIQSLEGIRDCNAFCMHHLCCFNGEGCGSYPFGICDDYSACQVLVKDVVATPGDVTNNFSGSVMRPTPSTTANGHDFAYHDPDRIRSSIASACSFDPLANDDSWVSGCHDLCADHLCCFGTPGTTSGCGNERGLMCNDYAGCSVLVHSKDLNHEEIKNKYVAHGPEMWPGSSVVPDDIREVNAACNNNVLGDSALKSRCEAACSSRNCCFTNGLGNCYLMVRSVQICLYTFLYLSL